MLALAAQPGRVDQPEVPLVAHEDGVDAVAGGASHLRHDHARPTQDRVQQRGLADVGATEDRHPDLVCGVLVVLGAVDPLERLHDRVQQVACAAAVQRRHRDRITQPQRVQLQPAGLVGLIVHLVGDHQHGPSRAAQDLRDLLVAGGQPGTGVDHEQHQMRLLHGDPRLLGDLGLHRRLIARVDAARVDQDELTAAPLAHRLGAVPGHARRLVHHRLATRRQPVDEGGLSRVREADHRHPARQAAVLRLLLDLLLRLLAHPVPSYRLRISAISRSAVSRYASAARRPSRE